LDDFFTSTLFISQTIITSVQEGTRTAFYRLSKNLSHHLASALAEHVAFSWKGFTLGKRKVTLVYIGAKVITQRASIRENRFGLRGGRIEHKVHTTADVKVVQNLGNCFVHTCHMRSIVHCMH
jgi:hypothetical protein